MWGMAILFLPKAPTTQDPGLQCACCRNGIHYGSILYNYIQCEKRFAKGQLNWANVPCAICGQWQENPNPVAISTWWSLNKPWGREDLNNNVYLQTGRRHHPTPFSCGIYYSTEGNLLAGGSHGLQDKPRRILPFFFFLASLQSP